MRQTPPMSWFAFHAVARHEVRAEQRAEQHREPRHRDGQRRPHLGNLNPGSPRALPRECGRRFVRNSRQVDTSWQKRSRLARPGASVGSRSGAAGESGPRGPGWSAPQRSSTLFGPISSTPLASDFDVLARVYHQHANPVLRRADAEVCEALAREVADQGGVLSHAGGENECVEAAERGRHRPDTGAQAVDVDLDRQARVVVVAFEQGAHVGRTREAKQAGLVLKRIGHRVDRDVVPLLGARAAGRDPPSQSAWPSRALRAG